MPVKLRKKLKGGGGFTLAETLIALMILLMVSAVVAAGVPLAANAYRKVVDSANADLLLSTTMTRLRSELAYASEVSCDGTAITYTSSRGSRSAISLETPSGEAGENSGPGIYIREYADLGAGSDAYKRLLVSREASNMNLYVTYGAVACDEGLITFSDIEVKKEDGGDALTKIDKYEIRVLSEAVKN